MTDPKSWIRHTRDYCLDCKWSTPVNINSICELCFSRGTR